MSHSGRLLIKKALPRVLPFPANQDLKKYPLYLNLSVKEMDHIINVSKYFLQIRYEANTASGDNLM